LIDPEVPLYQLSWAVRLPGSATDESDWMVAWMIGSTLLRSE